MKYQKDNGQTIKIPEITSLQMKKSNLIGAGSFGQVYLAFEDNLGMPVTVK